MAAYALKKKRYSEYVPIIESLSASGATKPEDKIAWERLKYIWRMSVIGLTEAQKEKYREYSRRWKNENPDKARAYRGEYRKRPEIQERDAAYRAEYYSREDVKNREKERRQDEGEKKKSRERVAKWRDENRDRVREMDRLYYHSSNRREKRLARRHSMSPEEREKFLQGQRLRDNRGYRKSRERLGLTVGPWKKYSTEEERIEARRESMRAYKERNPERVKCAQRKSKAKHQARYNAYQRNRRKTNPQYLISRRIRNRIWSAMKGCKNGTRKPCFTIEAVGCTYLKFKEVLESRMPAGMTFDDLFNGRAHIDHIIPVSLFNMESEDELKLCFSYVNSRPMWSADNLSKSNTLLPISQIEQEMSALFGPESFIPYRQHLDLLSEKPPTISDNKLPFDILNSCATVGSQ